MSAGHSTEKDVPARSEKRRRNAMVSIRFTPEELSIVQHRATELGMSISGFARARGLGLPDPPYCIATRSHPLIDVQVGLPMHVLPPGVGDDHA